MEALTRIKREDGLYLLHYRDQEDNPEFVIEATDDHSSSRITVWSRDGAPDKEYEGNIENHRVFNFLHDGEHAWYERYLHVLYKWDACCHFWFGHENNKEGFQGYLHICGLDDHYRHAELMKHLYEIAKETMASSWQLEEDGWPDTWPDKEEDQ